MSVFFGVLPVNTDVAESVYQKTMHAYKLSNPHNAYQDALLWEDYFIEHYYRDSGLPRSNKETPEKALLYIKSKLENEAEQKKLDALPFLESRPGTAAALAILESTPPPPDHEYHYGQYEFEVDDWTNKETTQAFVGVMHEITQGPKWNLELEFILPLWNLTEALLTHTATEAEFDRAKEAVPHFPGKMRLSFLRDWIDEVGIHQPSNQEVLAFISVAFTEVNARMRTYWGD